jgi:hypothetical protein
VSCRLPLCIGFAEATGFSGPRNNLSLTPNGGHSTMMRIILTAMLVSASALLAWVSVSATDSGPFLGESVPSDLVGGKCWRAPASSCTSQYKTITCDSFACTSGLLVYYCPSGKTGQCPSGCYTYCTQGCYCGCNCCKVPNQCAYQTCGIDPICGCSCIVGCGGGRVCSTGSGSTPIYIFPVQVLSGGSCL